MTFLGSAQAFRLADVANTRGFGVYYLDGTRMTSQADVFREFAMKLEFPEYFGENWDALDECLADLDWLDQPGYLLIIKSAKSVLRDEEIQVRQLFERLLLDIAKEWSASDPAVVFRVISVIQEP